MMEFILANYVALIFGAIALAEVVVRLTPTTKDDSIVNIIKRIADAIFPNHKKKGGLFQ